VGYSLWGLKKNQTQQLNDNNSRHMHHLLLGIPLVGCVVVHTGPILAFLSSTSRQTPPPELSQLF